MGFLFQIFLLIIVAKWLLSFFSDSPQAPGRTSSRKARREQARARRALPAAMCRCLGRMLVDGIFQRDFPVIQGAILFIVIAVFAVNLLTDLLYRAFDPRVKA